MPPKQPIKKGAPNAMIAKIKMQMEMKKKAEEEEQKRIEEEEKKIAEEIKLAEEQRKYEEEQKVLSKLDDKEKQKMEKLNQKKMQKFEALLKMRDAGMIVPETPEFLEYVKNCNQKLNIKKNNDAVKTKEIQEEKQQREEQTQQQEFNNYRSPICCVLGHVDAGKTSLLDKLRQTNIQQNEAGGITQQIGATFFSKDTLINSIKQFKSNIDGEIKVPGLLLIDTPGHEQFTNLRKRGSSISDIAILVVDITHGLQQQTRESIKLLKQKKCPFIVALNKVDRIYGWKTNKDLDIKQSLSLQEQYAKAEYETRISNIKLQLAEEGFNSELYYDNNDMRKYVSIIPVSAKSGEGIVDLLYLKIKLIQQFMDEKITFKDDLECSVLEVKPINGLGMTIDVILVNGVLHRGDQIMLCGYHGPIVTRIKTILTPQIKGDYINNNSIKASQCVKITADNLENVMPGTQLYVVNSEDEINKYTEEINKDIDSVVKNIAKDKNGITIQSSSLGSLEALLILLKDNNIPVGNIALGPIHKKNIMHSINMKRKNAKYACILAFDVEISQDAKILAEKENIKIYNSNIIYHLSDKILEHVKNYDLITREKNKLNVVFPCVLKVLSCFRAKDPMIIGVKIEEGQVRVGTPLIVRNDGTSLGKIIGIQINNKDIQIGKKGMELAIKLEGITMLKYFDDKGEEKEREQLITFGRHFDENSVLCSKISRKSIDALKESFRDEMTTEEWHLIVDFKKEQNIE